MQPFVADIFPEGWIHGRTVRSPVPRGRLKVVHVPPLPAGYVAVLAADIPGDPFCRGSVADPLSAAIPCLARERIGYAGEPVLLLGGPDPQRLALLAEAVQIEIEEEEGGPSEPAGAEAGYEERLFRGEAAAGFAAAQRIVEGEYRVGSLEHLELETQGAVAVWENGGVHVTSTAHDAADLRRRLSRLLKLPLARVRVTDPRPQLDPQDKPDPAAMAAAHAALLARAARRPVRLVYSRAEDLLYTPKSPPAWIRHRTGLDREGNPVAGEVEIRLDGGAYPACSLSALRNAALAACGAYAWPNVEVRATLMRSDGAPAGAFRGLGTFQAFFAAELHAARLAEVAQVDPVAWKARNLLGPGDALLSGARLKDPMGGSRVLAEVVRLSDFQRRQAAYGLMRLRRLQSAGSGPLRGIGLSVCCQPGERAVSWAGTVVDLEVDPVSLQGVCRGIWVTIDAGRIGDAGRAPNLQQARQLVEGAVLRSLGCAALEIGGILRQRPDHYADYGVPGFLDAPPIEVCFLEPAAGGRSSARPRGLGDLPFLGFFPAYAAAITQATGCYIDQIPTLPESIQTCLEPV